MAQAQRETGDYLAFVVNGSRKLAEEMAGVDAAVATLRDAPAFAGLKLLDRHRLVKEKLKDVLDSGELHALSLTMTKTPEEAQ